MSVVKGILYRIAPFDFTATVSANRLVCAGVVAAGEAGRADP
jgi:hypothetical protein